MNLGRGEQAAHQTIAAVDKLPQSGNAGVHD